MSWEKAKEFIKPTLGKLIIFAVLIAVAFLSFYWLSLSYSAAFYLTLWISPSLYFYSALAFWNRYMWIAILFIALAAVINYLNQNVFLA